MTVMIVFINTVPAMRDKEKALIERDELIIQIAKIIYDNPVAYTQDKAMERARVILELFDAWQSPEDSKSIFMVGFDEFIREQGRRKDDS